MYYIAVCDDDNQITELIEQYIREIIPSEQEITIIRFASGEAFCKSLEVGNYYDIIFMDYEMGQINGLDVGVYVRKNQRTRKSLIIYVSNHSEVIWQLLQTQVFEFISKPIDFQEFEKKFLRAYLTIQEAETCYNLDIGRETLRIPVCDILYVASENRQLRFFTKQKEYTVYGKLDEIEKKLDMPGKIFIRIHKSFLVNMEHVTLIKAKEVVLENNESLPISAGYKERVKVGFIEFQRRREAWMN